MQKNKYNASTHSGKYNKRITILLPPGEGEQDEWGQPLDTASEVCKIWSAIQPLRGQDRAAAAQVTADVTTRIRIRYREGIDRTMVVRYKETEFEILYIIHPEFNRRELQLMCKEHQ
ncbi:phage head closure protein [Paenibacillus odorifer]|uniref:phage head closure protein n=1 Tax=Paenibacillus odorifer TaxID=189426 RepID=UPI00096ECD76|nr:phage head closure protein [Paenibacillus odorifer]OME59480.1 phage head-tail adapter protein [Paenibacillus odorifer]